VYGDGSQTRDYVYVGDVVRAFLAAADSGQPGNWNIGTGVETSVLDLVRVIGGASGHPLHPQLRPARPGELQRSVLAVGLAQQELSWQAATGLADGIGAVYHWIEAGADDRSRC